jgi:hypothetical protein
MDVDEEAIQIQANFQLAAERLRARAARGMGGRPAAEDGDNDDADAGRTGEAAEARNGPRNDSDPETEISRRRGFGGISAEDYERIKANAAKRAERAAANDDDDDDDDDDDTDDSRAGEAAEARNVPRYESDPETEIGRQRVFMGISAEDVEPQPEDDDDDINDAAAVQPQGRPARKQPLKQPLRRPRAKAADTSRLRAGERKVRTLQTPRQLATAKHEAEVAKWAADKAKWAKKPENKHKQYHVPKPALVQPRRTRSGRKLILLHFPCLASRLAPYCVTQMRYP